MLNMMVDALVGPYRAFPWPRWDFWHPTYDKYTRRFVCWRRSRFHFAVQRRRLLPQNMYRQLVIDALMKKGWEVAVLLGNDRGEIIGEFHWEHAPEEINDGRVAVDWVRAIDGGDIGGVPTAWMLCQRGLEPERPSERSKSASVGFCEREQKWYGWSHRAMYGFGIGDVVKEGDCCATSGWIDEYVEQARAEGKDFSLPVGFEAKTLDDARRMAVAFADSVS